MRYLITLNIVILYSLLPLQAGVHMHTLYTRQNTKYIPPRHSVTPYPSILFIGILCDFTMFVGCIIHIWCYASMYTCMCRKPRIMYMKKLQHSKRYSMSFLVHVYNVYVGMF